MEGRSRHCPHLGLKHTRSIRFSSPTPEHRCYIFGEPLEIQVDQREYCLGDRYPECPRFAGQEAPPSPANGRPARAAGEKKGGLGGFWQGLGKRDRILYLSLAGLLVAILATYGIIIGVVLPARSGAPTPVAVTEPVPTTAAAVVVPSVPTAEPTREPTVAPTGVPTVRPTTPPTAAPATEKPPVTSPIQPTATMRPTTPAVPPTAAPTAVPPTAAPTAAQPTTAPTAIVPTPEPTPDSMWSLLYFLGPGRGYHVPVERQSRPYAEGTARRALELMIQGPRGSLQRSMPAGMGVNWDQLRVEGGTLYLDLDRTFESLGAGQPEALAVVLAMTEFSTVSRVQFSVNGAPYGLPGSGSTAPVERPAYVNFEDPYGVGAGSASNLILYFATPDGAYLFPVVRRVAYTEGVARATIEEMVKGPLNSGAITLLPAGTAIQGITRAGDAIVVDFSSAFLNAANRKLTVQALALAMTDLTADQNFGVTSIRISVDGTDLGSYWGSEYSGDLYRPLLNPELP